MLFGDLKALTEHNLQAKSHHYWLVSYKYKEIEKPLNVSVYFK